MTGLQLAAAATDLIVVFWVYYIVCYFVLDVVVSFVNLHFISFDKLFVCFKTH